MAARASERIWNNVVTVNVCEAGYEWRLDNPLADSESAELKLHPRNTEVVTDGGTTAIKTMRAAMVQKTGPDLERSLVAALRDVAERLDWLLLDPREWNYESRISRAERLFTKDQRRRRDAATVSERKAWAQSVVSQFTGEYGMLTSRPETVYEWKRRLDTFGSVDRLCTAIKRNNWNDVDRYMQNNGTSWMYIDVNLIKTICTRGDYWQMSDGSDRDWYSMAGRPSERAKMAFSRIINEKLDGAFSVRVDRQLPSQGVLTPHDLLSSGYFMLWRSVAVPQLERDCDYCEYPLPADKVKDPRAHYCNSACKQAMHRRRLRDRRA